MSLLLGNCMIAREHCVALDQCDPLAVMRERFVLPRGEIYLDGNSLGALPRAVIERMRRAIADEWGLGLVRSWNEAGWYPAPQRVGAKIAALIGAEPDEVIACDSTSVNLFKALIAASRLRPGRRILLAERDNFPTDAYIASGVAELLGLTLRLIDPSDIERAIEDAGEALAVVQLTHVNYKSGRIYDMASVTDRTHCVGAISIWDLCHSAGTLAVNLNACGVDFAVGCGYKYLNGGPGAPAYIFVARRHLASARQPLTGWHGHARPFAFLHDYQPHEGIAKMLVGTAPQLSLLALDTAIDVFDDVNMLDVRAKGCALSDLFIRLVDQEVRDHGFAIVSPRDSAVRGSQVSLAHPDGYSIMQSLIARGIIGDFRAPDILRFGMAPLYVSYTDIWDAVAGLRDVMQSGAWDKAEFKNKKAVT